ncbi:K(+)/H(+) antiporter [Rhizoclosmatium sp. JEL0117]|nr:K(+)/H(+) antiporter [Rhizoclosmatium sp. JEL0117]
MSLKVISLQKQSIPDIIFAIHEDSSGPGTRILFVPCESNFRNKLFVDILDKVGLELDPTELFKTFKKSVSISVAGIVLPFALGAAISRITYENYADPSVSYTSFLLFIGVAMSITAFPVLARILTERKLLHTKVGQATISAAACDDFIAWTLLVLVVALINNGGHGDSGSYTIAVYVFLTVIGWTLFLWFGVRPLLSFLVNLAEDREHLNHLLLFIVFTLVLFSSWFTEIIGVQAIFGAFLAGIIMPHEHGFARKLASQIEDLVTVVFLPLYFAYSGLNTQLGLLDDGKSWSFVALVCFVACAGKMLGCTVAARTSGLNWRESSAVGILMNTRGLVQIIVLNVGLQAKVITPKLFAIFVLMAIFTTFLTVPLIAVVYPASYYEREMKIALIEGDVEGGNEKSPQTQTAENGSHIRSLIYLPSMGVVSPMMSLCSLMHASPSLDSLTVFALHLIKMDSRFTTVMQAAEKSDFIKEDALLNVFCTFTGLHKIPSHPIIQVADADDIAPTIINCAKLSSVNLVIIPQLACKRIEGTTVMSPSHGWMGLDLTQQASSVAKNVRKSLASASVVHFIDRGFLSFNATNMMKSPTSIHFPVEPKLSNEQSNNTLKQEKHPEYNLLVIVGSDSELDDLASISFAKHIAESRMGEDLNKFDTTILRLDAAINVPSKKFQIIKDAKDIRLTSDTIQTLTNYIANFCRNPNDLAVVGENVLLQNTSWNGIALEHWLQYSCNASIAIVYGHE